MRDGSTTLDSVVVIHELGKLDLESLSRSALHDSLVRWGSFLHGVSVCFLPVVEFHLRECLTGGLLSEELRESEGLGNGQEGSDLHKRRSDSLLHGIDFSSSRVEGLVNSTESG